MIKPAKLRVSSACAVALSAMAILAASAAHASECRTIEGTLVEARTTQGCDPGLPFCFLGEVKGNHGLEGVTHFKGDSAAAGPSTAPPGFNSYSGQFQYRTAAGNIDARETGVVNNSSGQPQSGALTAYQLITGGTGAYEGASGFLFVSGHNTNKVITTIVNGQLCLAR